MPLQVEIPEDIRGALESRWSDLSLHLKENLAVEGYREGLLSLAQVRRLLGLSTRWDAQRFLGERGVAVFDLDTAELDREATLHRSLAARAGSPRR